MAGRNAQTTLTLRLVDGVTKPGRSIVGALRGVNAAVGAVKSGSLGIAAAAGLSSRSLATYGARLDKVAAAGVAGGGALALGASALVATERALNSAVAAGNLSAEERAAVYRNAIKLNYDYGGSVTDVIGAQNELLRSGLSLADSYRGLPDVMNLSQATEEGTVDVARAIVTNLAALRLGMDQTAQAADRFQQALDRTAGLKLEAFETSGKYFNPVAAAVGLTPDETMALQIESAIRGTSGSSAGTGLRAAPAAILAPTEKALASYARLRLDPRQFQGDRTGEATAQQILGTLEARGAQTEGLEDAITAIVTSRAKDSEKTKAIVSQFGEQMGAVTAEDRAALTTALRTAFQSGARRADVPALLTALRERGAGFADYEALFGRNHASKAMGFNPVVYLDELRRLQTEAIGATSRKSATMMAGLPGDVNQAEGSVQGLIAAISNAGALSDLSRGFRAAAEALTMVGETNPALLRFGVLATAAVAAMAPLGFAASTAAAGFGLMISPLTIAAAGLGSFAAMNLTPIANGLRTFRNSLARTVDPTILRAIRNQAGAFRVWGTSFRLGRLDLNRAADDLGRRLGGGISNLARSMPQLRATSAALAAFGSGAVAALGPNLRIAAKALEGVFRPFVEGKIAAVRDLGSALGDFGARAGSAFSPALVAGLDLVGASFSTMVDGAEAAVRVLNAAQAGAVAFATGFLGAISPETLAAVSGGMSSLAGTVSGPVRMLGEGFRSISSAVTGATGSITSFASAAGAGLGSALGTVADVVGRAASLIVAAFDRIVATVAAAKAALSSFSMPSLPTPSILGGGSGGLAGRVAPVPIGRPALLGGKAAGGAVRRGPYLVGERGPEVVTMGGNGYVTPNHRLSSGGDRTIHHWNITGANADEIAHKVRRELGRDLSRSKQTTLRGR